MYCALGRPHTTHALPRLFVEASTILISCWGGGAVGGGGCGRTKSSSPSSGFIRSTIAAGANKEASQSLSFGPFPFSRRIPFTWGIPPGSSSSRYDTYPEPTLKWTTLTFSSMSNIDCPLLLAGDDRTEFASHFGEGLIHRNAK